MSDTTGSRLDHAPSQYDMVEALIIGVVTGFAPVLPFVAIGENGKLEQFLVQPTCVDLQEPRSTVWKVTGYDTETLRGIYSVFDAESGTGVVVHGDDVSHQIVAFAEMLA